MILISIDTLRSDRLPAYGYDRVATPALDAFAAEAVVFERAYSHYPLTLPAHCSMLTGLLPTEHGVRDNVGYDLDTETQPYLPRLLKEAGYATGGAVSAFVLEGESSGLSQHFDLYDDAIETGSALGLGSVQREGGETLALTSDWLQTVAGPQAKGTQPFFLFFHIYEPHSPYEPPEPFASRYANPYDGEVAAADAVIGGLLDELRRLGVYDEAIIVLLSDHGEGLGDHVEPEHGVLLYREALQVPLILKLPGGARGGTRVSAPAQLIDVMPTVLALLGLPLPSGLQGTSLLELGTGGEPRAIYAETFYPRLHMGWSELTSLIEGDYHFIQGPDPELYDLAADPRQRTNLVAGERRTFARLRDRLAPYLTPLTPPSEVDEATAERMAALGYLSAAAPDLAGPLPDPKSKIHVLEDMGTGLRHIAHEEFAEAVTVLEGLLEENPEMQDAWALLGQALGELGRFPEAVAAYRRAIKSTGPVPHLLMKVSSLYLQLGRLSEAEEHARLAMAERPSWANLRLSEVALARDDLEEAERLARLAVEDRGNTVRPMILLARILAARGKLAEAGATLTAAADEMGRRTSQEELPNIHFVRGDLAARQGRSDEAQREFLEEIRLYPENVDAYARLAFLYAVEGQPDKTRDTLRRMIETAGTPAGYAVLVKTLRGLGDERSAAAALADARRRFPESEQLRTM